MKLLALLLLFVGTVHADPPFTILPLYPTGETGGGIGVANTLYCARYVLSQTKMGSTKLAGNVTTGFGAGKKITWSIYPDGNALTRIATTGPLDATLSGAKTATGLTSFDLTGGVTYRTCVCATGTSGGYEAANLTKFQSVANAFVASVGTAANSCDGSGNPPTTTGALSADSTVLPPILLVDSE